ncbi:Eco57I restriction-modification methylase domain-containing protein [Thauera linaloolentis]|uniref:site-specific DNA-methyltransferase (adenine-specific) n=1 Tax=Thauera linaloolentis (strain DSM 12138 / JCM 21573 / CCUG 41526 / CIP 105981 / IAM 15112 / NBRC 102519 / 47Lol) TaxID=1123367 RepID=N6YPW3_THAL4|nr:class I SAM-dependent methyltransferase [Thauera linaloolentis]ENO84412.1 modification methyltransferase [Thauera linaloolentis 47Lol = DSM 12138]MCM8565098.1 class I SAM-dependent methyltransferase [Thauera linaloolentis]
MSADPPLPPRSAQLGLGLRDIAALGQVFTPEPVVRAMLALRRNTGRVLEPSCGDGAFLRHLPGAVGLELDPDHCPPGARVLDFFAYPEHERFGTIIGNPPYVRFQDIPAPTRELIARGRHGHSLDRRSNLYLFFIEKCLHHLEPGGELIFITPRDFLKATSAVKLNRLLAEAGSITDAIELGDARVFPGALPNCLIWRFEKGRRDHAMRYCEIGVDDALDDALAAPAWAPRHFVESAGHLMFAREDYPLRLSDVASVKVGAVSGADALYVDAAQGNREFVCSSTVSTGRTRRMIWPEPGEPPPAALLPHKARLLQRKVARFDESNWWMWGRMHHRSARPRVYVNGKTRVARPFFVHDCTDYDGAVMAVFPHRADADVAAFRDALNAVDWADLGFVCDGRFLFTQRSLENAPLPAAFAAFLPAA